MSAALARSRTSADAELQHADMQQCWGSAKRCRRKVLLSCFSNPVTAEPGLRGLTMFSNQLFASCCCFRLLRAPHVPRRPNKMPMAHTNAANQPFAANKLHIVRQSPTPNFINTQVHRDGHSVWVTAESTHGGRSAQPWGCFQPGIQTFLLCCLPLNATKEFHYSR